MIESLFGALTDRRRDQSVNRGKKRNLHISEGDLTHGSSNSKKFRTLNEIGTEEQVTVKDKTSPSRDTKGGIVQRFTTWLSTFMPAEEVVNVERRPRQNKNKGIMLTDFQRRSHSDKENENSTYSVGADISAIDQSTNHLHRQKHGVADKYSSAIKISRVDEDFSPRNEGDSFIFQPVLSTTPRCSAIRNKTLLKDAYPIIPKKKFSYGLDETFQFQSTLLSNADDTPVRKKTLYNTEYKTTSEKKLSSMSKQSLSMFKPMLKKFNISKPRCPLDRTTNTLSFLRNVTANESFKLDEKLRYKSLLQNFTSFTHTSGNLTRKFLHRPAGDFIAAQKAQNVGAIKKECFNPAWGHQKKSNLEKTKIGLTRGTSKSIHSNNRSKIYDVIDLDSDSDLDASEKEDSDVIITKEIFETSPPRNSLEEMLRTSPFYIGVHSKERKKQYEWKKQRQSEATEAALEKTRQLELLRKKRESNLEDKISRRLANLEITFPTRVIEVSAELEDVLPEITKPIMAIIFKALRGGPPHQVVADKFNIRVTRKDIHTLAGLNWLNDEVVNFYMNLIMDRNQEKQLLKVYAFNTFFYPKLYKTGYSSVRRWTKKIDIFSYDLLIVPVHLDVHWCLATIDLRDRTVRYYDSMHGDNHRCLQELLKYLNSEHTDKKKELYDTSNWKMENIKDIPQQMNGSDCGMFSCKFAEYLSRDSSISFSQEHMPYFRQRMIYEICSMKLM